MNRNILFALVLCTLSHAMPAEAQIVQIDGSSTVFPITEAVAEEFQKAKKGKISGKLFWGCVNFPDCKMTLYMA